MVNLRIKIVNVQIVSDPADEDIFTASVESPDSIIAGYGDNPYDAVRDLINELEYQHQYFRADDE